MTASDAMVGGAPFPIICVTGASGFIGAHVVPLLRRSGVSVRVLTRSAYMGCTGVEAYVGDIFDAASLVRFMEEADLLINLAQPSGSLTDEHFSTGMSNLAQAARNAGVRRVLHISTAMVIGVPSADRVTEETIGMPKTSYERQKHAAEQVLHNELGVDIDLGILRPTAVFGDGGQNLLKLADVIVEGSALMRRLLRVLHGKRKMHLVSVKVVVEAIIFLAFMPRSLAGNVFLIASDDEPDNNYQAVDAILGGVLGKPLPRCSVSIPALLLSLLLRMAGRSQADPSLVYDSSKIRSWGFLYQSNFASALKEFAEAYMKNKGN